MHSCILPICMFSTLSWYFDGYWNLSFSMCAYMKEREYLFLIFEIFARDYHWWIDVVQCYLRMGIVNIRWREWEQCGNERYENYEWKNKLSVDSVQCKLNPIERDVNSRMNSFISWWELGVFGLRKSDPLLHSSFFCCCWDPKIGLPARQSVSILCYNRAQPATVEITSFIMDSDQFALAELKKIIPSISIFLVLENYDSLRLHRITNILETSV